MLYIRKGVFETNSSSSHSIVMMKRDNPAETVEDSNMVDAGWHVNENGIMDFWYEDGLEFGRTFDMLTDWFGRLRYAIATFGEDKYKLNKIKEICQRRIAGFVNFHFPRDKWENRENHGYIDHQSLGLLESALARFDVSLEDFIFNDKFVVVIDGDEYNFFCTFVDTDMFNKDAVEDIASASYGLDTGNWRDEESE